MPSTQDTGCVRWTFRASAEVRTAIVVESPEAARARNGTPRVFFGDLLARVYAVDAFSGALVWQHKADDHPNATITAAPALHAGTLYVPVSSLEVTSAADPAYECCTFRGSVLAMDAPTGAQRWKTYTLDQPPAPVGKTTGRHAHSWPCPEHPSGIHRPSMRGAACSTSAPAKTTPRPPMIAATRNLRCDWPMAHSPGTHSVRRATPGTSPACCRGILTARRRMVLTWISARPTSCWTAASPVRCCLPARNPVTCMASMPTVRAPSLWRTKVGRGGIQGGVHFGMATDGVRLFVPISDMKDEHDGQVFSEPSRAGLYALDPLNGKVLWSAPATDQCAGRELCDHGISAAITAIPNAVLAGHMDGHLRAYDSASGRILWDVDTTQEWKTVSGATGPRRLFRRWRRPDCRRWQSVRRLGLRNVFPHARQCAAGVRPEVTLPQGWARACSTLHQATWS